MQRSLGVFGSDQVNRYRILIPASELMRSHEVHVREAILADLPLGMPSYIQHDMHRLHGWSRQLGLYLDSRMVRVLGQIEKPDNADDLERLRALSDKYWEQFHQSAMPFEDDLKARAKIENASNAQMLQIEAAVIKSPGIARELYPDLFDPETASVDKDGLVDFSALLERFTQIQPGVFHDPEPDLLIFAHRFFRKSLSHRNKLNSDFLETFAHTAETFSNIRARLRLDPDIVGHPESAKNLLELEYWRGPKYDDVISNIPDGVSEHKSDADMRHFHGVDRTQIWWKRPESRLDEHGRSIEYRTFEIEELIEHPSGGLVSDQFGCRYAHAEYSDDENAITHFDGAIRAYDGDVFLERIDTSIDRAGKYANYTKLFRFDGPLPVQSWKSILTNYFRGNDLVPEYLGALHSSQTNERKDAEEFETSELQDEQPHFAALITLVPGDTRAEKVCFYYDSHVQLDEHHLPFLELGLGSVAEYIRENYNLGDLPTGGSDDGILNLSRTAFGLIEDIKQTFDEYTHALGQALKADADAGLVKQAAIPLTWENDGLLVTLTLAGEAQKVASVLCDISSIVNPKLPPSEWIQGLSGLIKQAAPQQSSDIMWNGVFRGALEIERVTGASLTVLFPKALVQRLKESGVQFTEPDAPNSDESPIEV